MNYQITCVCGNRFFITEQQLTGHVTCPSCGRALIPVVTPNPSGTGKSPPAVAADPAGQAAGAPTESPVAQPESAVATSAEATKRCPFCGEVILAIAKKCKHCGEFLDRAPPHPLTASSADTAHPVINPSHPTAPSAGTVEPPIFAVSVSQWDNLWKFLILLTIAVLVPIGLIKISALREFAPLGVPITVVLMAVIAWFFYYSTRNSRCIVRPMRIETEVGVLSKDLTSLDLFRVTDLELKQSFIERMIGIGTIRVTSNDPNTPELVIYQVPKARQIFRYLQQQVPIAARQRGAVYLER